MYFITYLMWAALGAEVMALINWIRNCRAWARKHMSLSEVVAMDSMNFRAAVANAVVIIIALFFF